MHYNVLRGIDDVTTLTYSSYRRLTPTQRKKKHTHWFRCTRKRDETKTNYFSSGVLKFIIVFPFFPSLRRVVR
jgi:hypothetical protein